MELKDLKGLPIVRGTGRPDRTTAFLGFGYGDPAVRPDQRKGYLVREPGYRPAWVGIETAQKILGALKAQVREEYVSRGQVRFNVKAVDEDGQVWMISDLAINGLIAGKEVQVDLQAGRRLRPSRWEEATASETEAIGESEEIVL